MSVPLKAVAWAWRFTNNFSHSPTPPPLPAEVAPLWPEPEVAKLQEQSLNIEVIIVMLVPRAWADSSGRWEYPWLVVVVVVGWTDWLAASDLEVRYLPTCYIPNPPTV